MRIILTATAVSLGFLLFFTNYAFPAKSQLLVYTYDSFSSEFGLGPKIAKIFEDSCDCQVQYQGLIDANLILTRLQLEDQQSNADLVIGIDNMLLKNAEMSNLFAEHQLVINSSQYHLPEAWNSKQFVPFDYGYLAFVYRRAKYPQLSSDFFQFLDKLDSQYSIALQDPRTSSPGLIFLGWLQQIAPNKLATVINNIDKKILTYPKSWGEAYQMFIHEEVDFVWSYVTSPLFHKIIEKDNSIAAYYPTQGNPLQVEYAAIVKNSNNKKLAQQFLELLLSTEIQTLITTTQWMYPIKKIPIDNQFTTAIPKNQTELIINSSQNKKNLVDEWQQAIR